jgi:hypothetical protein
LKQQPPTAAPKKSVLRRILKIFAWIIGSILMLFVLLWILIQIPAVQNFAVKKAVNYVQGKIGTPVRVDRITISFPKKIVLKGLYVENQQKDTLLYGKDIKVDISLFKLLKNTVELNELNLNGITSHIQRSAQGRFNFDYIIDAFASEDTSTSEDGGMEFSINDIILDNINIKYHDDFMGYDVGVALDHFDTDIKTFDLDKQDFKVDGIRLDGLTSSIRQYKPLADKLPEIDSVSAQQKTVLPTIALNTVILSRISFDYRNEIDSVFSNVQLGKLEIEPENIDLNKQILKLDELNLENTTAVIRLGKDPGAKQVAQKVEEVTDSVAQIAKKQGWVIAVANTDLHGNNFKYDDDNSPPITAGMDYSHLDIRNLRLASRDLYYFSDSVSGKIDQLAFDDKSGANVKSLQTEFVYTDQQAYLKDLDLQTADTRIRRNIAISYPSIASLSKDPGAMKIETDLTGSVIALKDVVYFAPALASVPLFQQYRNSKIQLSNLSLSGSLNDLNIKRLDLSGLKQTKLSVSGTLKNMMDPKKLYANLNIKTLSSTAADLAALLPKNALPDNIRIPQQFTIKGTVKGNTQNAETALNLSSSFGGANIKAIVSNITDSIRAGYSASVVLSKFDLGKLLKKEDQIGKISLSTTVHGKGYASKSMNAKAEGNIASAEVKGYTYKNLMFNGSASNGVYDIVADMDDANANFDLAGQMDLTGAMPAVNLSMMIDSIDLQALHFSKTPFKIHTKLTADFPVLDMDRPKGKLSMSEILINTGTSRYTTDSVQIIADQIGDGNSIVLLSPILTASLAGNYTLSGIGTAFTNVINQYYTISKGGDTTLATPQQADFYVLVPRSKLLQEMVPSLQMSDSVRLRGNINSATGMLVVDGIIPSLTYGEQHIDAGELHVSTKDGQLIYDIAARNYTSASIKIPKVSVTGALANNAITYQLKVLDDKDKLKYQLAGNMKQDDGNYALKLFNRDLLLNYETWNIDSTNQIVFGDAGVGAYNFRLTHNNQSLLINSVSKQLNAPIAVDIHDFKIETITNILNSDSLFMGGNINGKANISNLSSSPLFDADLTVKDFNFKKDTLGDIVIKANNETANSYTAHVTISGKGNDVDINGRYVTTGTNNLDFDVAIKSLNLATIESFTAGQLRNMSGDITGNLHIGGSPSTPKIIGDLTMARTQLVVSQLNALFKLDNEKIHFKEDGIHFDSFTIKDSTGNTAVIDGAAYTTNYSDYRFNLDLDANNFQVLNSKKKDNPLYFGLLYVDVDAKVRGDISKPIITADITINDKTDMTVVVPQTDPEVSQREDIVEFFDQDHPELDSMLLLTIDSLNHSNLRGYELSANVSIDRDAAFSIIIDEANGDFLKIKGDGNLSVAMDESGDITMTGSYQLKEGSYEMSVNFLRRKFDIKEGSILTWTGGPTDAEVDITAVYATKAAPIDLVERQLADVSAEVKNTYRQKIPFEVNLKMTGELLKPIIAFDIILPTGNFGVATEIIDATQVKLEELRNEPSELNKQVFALLLLNRFVAENPFESGGSTSVGTMARQSVSKLLTEQLNRIAEDLIQGVDINFGVESIDDYTTGRAQTRTDLNVGVSKQLFNDRLKVSVGSNFEVEGPSQANQKTANIAGDIQIDYKLSKDGSYSLRAYRKDQYEVALQGQVVETGLTFIISIEYDKFKEILKRAKEKKEIKQENREEKREAKKQEQSTEPTP